MEYIPLLILSVTMVKMFTLEPLMEESKFFASRTSYEVIRAKSLKEEDIPGMQVSIFLYEFLNSNFGGGLLRKNGLSKLQTGKKSVHFNPTL